MRCLNDQQRTGTVNHWVLISIFKMILGYLWACSMCNVMICQLTNPHKRSMLIIWIKDTETSSSIKYTYLSSPCNPLSMASGKLERRRSWVMLGDPLHKVDNRLITVDTLALVLPSPLTELLPGVDVVDALWTPSPTRWSRDSKSWMRPWLAKGAGSNDLRV